MEDLVTKIRKEHGFSEEQARGVIQTIAGYVKNRFPAVKETIDQFFQSGTTTSSSGATPSDIQSVKGVILPKPGDIPGH